MPRRNYPLRKGVDWYDPASGHPPRHDQKHLLTGKYWNAYRGAWCSKKCRRSVSASLGRISVLSWSCLPPTLTAEGIGRVRAERVRAFLTLLYRLQLIRHGQGHRRVLYIDNNTLKAFLGHRWSELVDSLCAAGILRKRQAPSRYDANKRCLYLSLGEGVEPDAGTGPPTLTLEDAALERSMERQYGRWLGTTGEDTLLAGIRSTLDQTVFRDPGLATPPTGDSRVTDRSPVTSQWLDFLSQLPAIRNETERSYLYGMVRHPFTGRIDHVYTPLPRAWQEGLRIGDEPTRRIGIRNSLAGLLSIRFSRRDRSGAAAESILPPTSFLSRFAIANQAGMEIFDYMALQLEGRDRMKHPGMFEEMRTLFLRMLFGPPEGRYRGQEVGVLIRQVFGADMVLFLKELRAGWKGKPDSFFHKNLSAVLQREEASLLAAAMTDLDRLGIPFLPMHDALVVRMRDANSARSALARAIDHRGWGDVLKT